MIYSRKQLSKLKKDELISLLLETDESKQKAVNAEQIFNIYSEEIIDLSPDAILLFRVEDLSMKACNKAALALLETQSRTVLDTYLQRLLKERPLFGQLLIELGEELEGRNELSVEIDFTTLQQQLRSGHLVCKKVQIFGEKLLFIRIIDITEIKETQKKLLSSERRLAESQKVARMGSFIIDIQTKESYYSDAFFELFEIDNPEKKAVFSRIGYAYMHKEDKAKAKQAIAELMQGEKEEVNFESRAITDAGNEKYFFTTIKTENDSNGDVCKLIGITQDITQRKLAEIKLMESEERYRMTAENTNDGIWYWNFRTGETFVSPNYRIMLGHEHENEEFVPEKWFKRVHPDDVEPTWLKIQNCLQASPPHFLSELRIRDDYGEYKWFETRGTAILDDKNHPQYMVGAITSIHERKMSEQALRQQDKILNFAQSIAKVGSWTWNIGTGDMRFSDELFNILEIPADKKLSPEDFNHAVVEQDRKKVSQFLENISNAADRQDTLSIEFSAFNGSGKTKVLRTVAKFLSQEESNGEKILIGTTQDITEVKQREEELIKAKEQAEIARRAKDHFLSIVSHEIRNPLNGIIGITKLLMQSSMAEQEKDHLQALSFSSNYLLSIINDILDTAKLQYGKLTLETIPFSLREQLQHAEEIFRSQLADKEAILITDISDNIPKRVLGDPTRFNQLIFNLLGNAIKYTYRGSIKLRARLLHEEAEQYLMEFSITDTGVGILKENLDRIFEAFEQDKLLINHEKGGTGLGLYIVRELISLMEGEIKVDSIFGQGTTFTLRLPFKKTEADTKESFPDKIESSIELRGKKVLYVEDAPYNQMLLKGYAQFWKLDLSLADDLRQAEELARQTNYDLVLVDFRLPDGDGTDVARLLKSINEHYRHTPFIVISAYSREEKQGLENYFDDYIQKPINFDKFFYVLRNYLKVNDRPAFEEQLQLSEGTPRASLAYIREHQPEHYFELIEQMYHDLQSMQQQLLMSVDQRNYRLYLQTVHKLSSVLRMIGKQELLTFLESQSDLPRKEAEKQKLRKMLMKNFEQIWQIWEDLNT
ncbi:MAG: PAS domain-containing protein [Cyclobacteriaceae bacterium]